MNADKKSHHAAEISDGFDMMVGLRADPKSISLEANFDFSSSVDHNEASRKNISCSGYQMITDTTQINGLNGLKCHCQPSSDLF
jgi:hypothetical protein